MENLETKHWGEITDNGSCADTSVIKCEKWEESEGKHWGELPDRNKDLVLPDISRDIELAMSKIDPSDFPMESEVADFDSQRIVLEPMDPLMLYAISLHKHANEMNEKIQVAEVAVESNVQPPADAALEIPQMPEITMRCMKNSINFVPKDFTPFSLGHETEVPELSSTVAKHALSNCIGTMLAHTGYENSYQSVVDVLVDVVEDFYKKIGHELKVAKEDEEKGYVCGFPHIAEKVLVQTGMGGVKGLHDYYQSRVIKYIPVLQKRSRELNKKYADLLTPKDNKPNNKSTFEVTAHDNDDDKSEVDTTVHYTTFDSGAIEGGLQLLETLESNLH